MFFFIKWIFFARLRCSANVSIDSACYFLKTGLFHMVHFSSELVSCWEVERNKTIFMLMHVYEILKMNYHWIKNKKEYAENKYLVRISLAIIHAAIKSATSCAKNNCNLFLVTILKKNENFQKKYFFLNRNCISLYLIKRKCICCYCIIIAG